MLGAATRAKLRIRNLEAYSTKSPLRHGDQSAKKQNKDFGACFQTNYAVWGVNRVEIK